MNVMSNERAQSSTGKQFIVLPITRLHALVSLLFNVITIHGHISSELNDTTLAHLVKYKTHDLNDKNPGALRSQMPASLGMFSHVECCAVK